MGSIDEDAVVDDEVVEPEDDGQPLSTVSNGILSVLNDVLDL